MIDPIIAPDDCWIWFVSVSATDIDDKCDVVVSPNEDTFFNIQILRMFDLDMMKYVLLTRNNIDSCCQMVHYIEWYYLDQNDHIVWDHKMKKYCM